MSKNLNKHKHFLSLLLTTDQVQANTLLDSITLKQVEIILEIVNNLLTLSSSISDKLRIKKRKTLLERLVNKKLKLSKKKYLVSKHN